MKRFPNTFMAAALLCLFTACGQSSSTAREASAAPTEKEPAAGAETAKTEHSAESAAATEAATASFFTVTCEEKEEMADEPEEEDEIDGEVNDPIITRTCTFRDHKHVAVGEADYKGRYSWVYSLYKVENGREVKVANSSLFNHRQNELLQQVNKRLQTEFRQIANDPENEGCLDGVEPLRDYKMDELNMYFMEGELVFNVELELGSACMAVSDFHVAYKLEELAPYLK
ncbi:hypothetical protein [Botryobacter ruber]|uniref:hypothetical protein n=1 Tax=Botryobacter ruber TaxID=2171629 RepID=UPI000F64BF6D|nr:hypothetical protein [Botryobacter ruber]